MQLSDMKSHPVIKWMAYFGFGLIIVSFVFFYGWDSSVTRARDQANAFGRIESDDALAFLPWRRWENIPGEEVRGARMQVVNRKLNALDPTMRMILIQEGARMGLRLENRLSNDAEALQQAVDVRLLHREANRIGLMATREEIVAQIRNQPGMSAEVWRSMLQAEGLSEAEYIERLRQSQGAYYVEELIADEARLTLPELWREYRLENEKLRLEVLTFPATRYTDHVEATDEELQAYLDEHREEYRVPAQRRYGYVRVDRSSIRADVRPTEEQVREYFEANAEAFRVPEAALIEDLFAPVTDDQPTTAAQQLIETARALGGAQNDWESVRDTVRRQFPEWRIYHREVGPVDSGADAESVHGRDYVEAALALSEGELSGVVRSPLGLHMMRRTGTRASAIPPLEEIRDRVERQYVDAEVGRLFLERQQTIRREVANYATLQEFAQEKGFDYGVTTWIDAAETNLPGVADLSPHRSYVRSLRPGQVSEMIPLGDRVVAIHVLEEQETHIPALDELRGEIAARIEVQKAAGLAREKAESAMREVVGGRALVAVARDGGSTTTLTPPVTRAAVGRGSPETGLSAPLIGFEGQTSRLEAGSVGVSPYGFEDGDRAEGYAVWRVRDIESPIREEFMDEWRRFAAGRIRPYQNLIIEEALADLRNRAKYEAFGFMGG
jgi:peptidyl-prolyl cis-trans isomerase D